MSKYRAKVDVAPLIKKGDIVDFKEELVEGFKDKFEAYNGDEEVTDVGEPGEPKPIINPSRTDLKKEAEQLGLDFAPNISTEKLLDLVAAKRAETNKEEDE